MLQLIRNFLMYWNYNVIIFKIKQIRLTLIIFILIKNNNLSNYQRILHYKKDLLLN